MMRAFLVGLPVSCATPALAHVGDLEWLRQAEVVVVRGSASTCRCRRARWRRATARACSACASASATGGDPRDRPLLHAAGPGAGGGVGGPLVRAALGQRRRGEAAPPVAEPTGRDAVTTTPSRKVRVLDKKGTYFHIRDAEGNEGWVPTDSL